MDRYNPQIEVLFSDGSGILFESKYDIPFLELRKGSEESMDYVRGHNESNERPKIICVVSGLSAYSLRPYLERMKIQHAIVEHGLGYLSPHEKGRTIPLYEIPGYSHLRDSFDELKEVRKILTTESQIRMTAQEFDVWPDQIVIPKKEFMVAIFIPYGIDEKKFMQSLQRRLDGNVNPKNLSSKLSHGAVDFKLPTITKETGSDVKRKELGLEWHQIAAIEDSDPEWLNKPGYVCCPRYSSPPVLQLVGRRQNEGTGEILTGNLEDTVIKEAIEKIKAG